MQPLHVNLTLTFLHSVSVALVMTAMIDLVSNIIYKGDVSAAAYFMGAMETINAAMQMISNPLWGVLSDQYGRKPFMLLSIIGFAAEMFWIAADVSFLSLVGATLLRGVTGVTYSLAATYTVDIAPSHDQMSVYLGYNAAAGGFGFMIGAGLSAVIGGLAGAKTTFLVSGCVGVINAVFTYLTFQEPLAKHSSYVAIANLASPHHPATTAYAVAPPLTCATLLSNINPFKNLYILLSSPTLLYLSIGWFLTNFAKSFAKILFLFTKYLFGWNVLQNGILIAYVALLMIIVQAGVLPRLVKMVREELLLKWCIVFAVVYMLVAMMVHTPVQLYVLMGVGSLGSILLPVLRGLVAAEMEESRQGELQGAMSAVTTMATCVGSFCFNGIFAYFIASEPSSPSQPTPVTTPHTTFPGAPFLLAAVIHVISMPFLWRGVTFRQAELDAGTHPTQKAPAGAESEDDLLDEMEGNIAAYDKQRSNAHAAANVPFEETSEALPLL